MRLGQKLAVEMFREMIESRLDAVMLDAVCADVRKPIEPRSAVAIVSLVIVQFCLCRFGP
jgi:hypothetical protein